jgi:hypothetical protein
LIRLVAHRTAPSGVGPWGWVYEVKNSMEAGVAPSGVRPRVDKDRYPEVPAAPKQTWFARGVSDG